MSARKSFLFVNALGKSSVDFSFYPSILVHSIKTASFAVSSHGAVVGGSSTPAARTQSAATPANASGTIRGKTSPYGFFVKMCYEEHRRKFPNEHVLVTEISKKCSEKWKIMSDLEKRRFFDLAQKDAQRYEAEIQAQGGSQTTKKKKRAKKDPGMPKRALSAFFLFSNEKRNEIQTQYPSWKVGQIAQELGKIWKSLSDEERRVFEKKANDDKERYNEEMKVFRESGPSSAQTPTTSNIQQATMKIESAPVQDMNNQPQTVQVQYVDQDGNILHVVNQPAFVTTSDNNAVYLNNPSAINEGNYENA